MRYSFLLGTTAQALGFWYIEDKSNDTEGLFPKRSILHEKPTRNAVQAKCRLPMRLVSQFPAAQVEGEDAAFKTYLHLNATEITY